MPPLTPRPIKQPSPHATSISKNEEQRDADLISLKMFWVAVEGGEVETQNKEKSFSSQIARQVVQHVFSICYNNYKNNSSKKSECRWSNFV